MTRTRRTTRVTRTARKARAADPLRALRTLGQQARATFDTLLDQGARLPALGMELAAGKADEARRMVGKRAGDVRERTLGVVNRFEKAFEVRVSRAVARLGVPSARDVRALSRQVSQLQQSVEQLRRGRARA